MAERERRIRLAYLEAAESWSRENAGRGLTEAEIEGVVRRFRIAAYAPVGPDELAA